MAKQISRALLTRTMRDNYHAYKKEQDLWKEMGTNSTCPRERARNHKFYQQARGRRLAVLELATDMGIAHKEITREGA
jgi:hypothetical protein